MCPGVSRRCGLDNCLGDSTTEEVSVAALCPERHDAGGPVPLEGPRPQHAMVPSVRIPHEYTSPAATAVNCPVGGFACPQLLLPQHATAPSPRSPQECQFPAVTDVNCPAGASACPMCSPPRDSLLPQQATVPSLRSAHECAEPAVMATNPAAGSGVAGSGVVGGRAVASASTELASQRFTAAAVGKNRTRGSRRSPQVLLASRCWRPNSIRPLASLRATIRTSPDANSSAELASHRSTAGAAWSARARPESADCHAA